MTTPTQGEHAQTALAHELFAAAQLATGEGIEDAVSRIAAALTASPHPPRVSPAMVDSLERAADTLERLKALGSRVKHLDDTPAQPAAPQGVAYAELPKLFREALAWGMTYGPEIPAHQWEEMRESMVKQYTDRASHGQATAGAAKPAGRVYSANCEYAVVQWLHQTSDVGGGDPKNSWSWPTAGDAVYLVPPTTTAQAAPAAGAVAGPRSADELALDLKKAIETATELREQLTLMEEHARGEVWRWQADGTDDLATMGNRMGVLIYASDLHAMLAAAPTTAAQADSVPNAQFDDPKVQAVYAILCDDTDWPPKENPQQHWEGWIARRIVDALLADSVLEDAARLDFLIEQRAYVVSAPDACPGYWLHFVHKETGKCWVQCDEHPTPRAAIDAARKQGGTHDNH